MADVALLTQLQQHVAGEVYADRVTRALYATDASPYQIDPVAVVVPRTSGDVRATLEVARRYGVPILPRGGATSLAGQTVGQAIQIDFSKYLNRVLELNTTESWVCVEPGVVLDHLNGELAPHGVKFAPDVSPANRATIGGMIGNNAAGAYSLCYGKTLDHVLELRVLLSDGTETTLRAVLAEELAQKQAQQDLEGACYRVVSDLARQHREEIERRYPKILRRVGGYNLDMFVDGKPFNLSNLIVGSEGTLAVVLEAKLRIVPRPAATGVVLLEFADLFAALDAVRPCLECDPVAVELLDDLLIDLTRRSLKFKHALVVLKTDAKAVLMVEFFGDDQEDVVAQMDRLTERLRDVPVAAATRAITPEEQAPVWIVRKASLPLLQSMSPNRKPETSIEDSAVPVEHLTEYVRRFKALVEAHGTVASFYGHASVGLLHVRPLLDLHDQADVRKLRSLGEGVRDLALEYGGAISGEHGDGLLRSEHNPIMFGPVLYEAFRTLKRTFDPQGILNPGKIVDAPPLDANLRYMPPRGLPVKLDTYFAFKDTGGMLGAAELCNGNAACRKTDSGTMCPSYMVTRDEEHSTRGRANALRLAIAGVLPPEDLWGERMHEVLDLCLECKGCTGECPSRVNLTRLKSEWLAHFYAHNGTPLRARLFGHIRTLNRIGSTLAPLSNALLQLPGIGAVNERLFGISCQRALPSFARQTFTDWFKLHRASANRSTIESAQRAPEAEIKTVVLFPDTFTCYNEPQIGIAATELLEALGYDVIIPARPVCCGRPQISKGLLPEVKRLVQQQLDWLAPYAEHGLPIVGLEPSCLLTFRDEYPDLTDDPRVQALQRQSLLLDEFLAAELQRGAFPVERLGTPASRRSVLVHGHCHQKALASTSPTLALLRAAGWEVREVDSGCCGMAGSFGYEREHYELSMAIGERRLFPAVRQLPETALPVAMGTSCRQQIAHATGRQAWHIAQVLHEQVRG